MLFVAFAFLSLVTSRTLTQADVDGGTLSLSEADCPVTLPSGTALVLPPTFSLTASSCVATCNGASTFFSWTGISLSLTGISVENCSVAGIDATGSTVQASVSLTNVGLADSVRGAYFNDLASLVWTGVTVVNNVIGIDLKSVASLQLSSGTLSDNGRIAINDRTSTEEPRSGSFVLSDLTIDRNGLGTYPTERSGVMTAPRLAGKGLAMTNVKMRGNRAFAGVLYLSDMVGDAVFDRVEISDTTVESFSDNAAQIRLTGLMGSVTIRNSQFLRNQIGDDGGFVHLNKAMGVSSIVVENVTFHKLDALNSVHGAIFVADMAGSKIDVLGSTFSNITARRCAALHMKNVTAPVRIVGTSPDNPSVFLHNSGRASLGDTSDGGSSIVLRDVDKVTIANCEFTADSGYHTGPIWADSHNEYRGRYSTITLSNILVDRAVMDTTSSSGGTGPPIRIEDYDEITIEHSTIQNCQNLAGSVGGMYVRARRSTVLDNVRVIGNVAWNAWGGVRIDHALAREPEDNGTIPVASATLTNVTIEDNIARGSSTASSFFGGALSIDQVFDVSIADSRFANNMIESFSTSSSVYRRGGAIGYVCDTVLPYGIGCSLTMRNCSVSSNFAPNMGGGIAVRYVERVDLDRVTFSRNMAHVIGGAAIFSPVGHVKMSMCMFDENVVGGTYLHDPDAIRGYGGAFHHDSASFANGTLDLSDVAFIRNRALGYAGAFLARRVPMTTVHKSLFLENVAIGVETSTSDNWGGGAIALDQGGLNMSNSTLSRNVVLDSSGKQNGGGAVFAYPYTQRFGYTVRDSYLLDNVAVYSGWALHFEDTSTQDLNITRTSMLSGSPSALPVVSFGDAVTSPVSPNFTDIATTVPTADAVSPLYTLAYSLYPDFRSPAALDGAKLPSDHTFFVFANPYTTFGDSVRAATCYINGVLASAQDPQAGGFDCAGTTARSGTNVVWDTTFPPAGAHAPGEYTITMEFFTRPYVQVANATFEVLPRGEWSGSVTSPVADQPAVPFPSSIAGVPDPAGHWPLDDPAPVTGSVVVDASGNGVNGTMVGAPETLKMAMPNGVVRSVTRFAQVRQYVDLPNEPVFRTRNGNSFTVTAWVWACTEEEVWIFSFAGAWTLALNRWDGVEASSSVAGFGTLGGCAGPQQQAVDGPRVTNGKWHFVAGTFRPAPNGTVEISVDTTFCTSCIVSSALAAMIECAGPEDDPWNITIGQHMDQKNDPSPGAVIADVRYYNTALTDGELELLFLGTGGTTALRDETAAAGDSVTQPDWPPAQGDNLCSQPLYRPPVDAPGEPELLAAVPYTRSLVRQEWTTLQFDSSCACSLDVEMSGIECFSDTRVVLFAGDSRLMSWNHDKPCDTSFLPGFVGFSSVCDAADACPVDPLAIPEFLYPPAPTPAPPIETPAPGDGGEGEGEGGLGDVQGRNTMDEGEMDPLVTALIVSVCLLVCASCCAAVFAYMLARLGKKGAIDSTIVLESLDLDRFGAPGRKANVYMSQRSGTSDRASFAVTRNDEPPGVRDNPSPPRRDSDEHRLGDSTRSSNYTHLPPFMDDDEDASQAASYGNMTDVHRTDARPTVSSAYSAIPTGPRGMTAPPSTGGTNYVAITEVGRAGTSYTAMPTPAGSADHDGGELSPRQRRNSSRRRKKSTSQSREVGVDSSNYARITLDQEDVGARTHDYGTPQAPLQKPSQYMDLDLSGSRPK